MSDHDRITDYVARMENPQHRRTLEDGCAGCSESLLACNASRYLYSRTCCPSCSGH